MKIGDHVRFLSEVGGGRVSGFQGKNIVLVEDEDGFEIPMQVRDVIVVQPPSDSPEERKVHTKEPKGSEVSPRGDLEGAVPPQKVFKPKPLERREGERLNLYLSFLPDEVKEISSTGFESYLVNDSNYYMQVSLMSAEGASWRLRFCGIIEPNSKLFVEAFDRSQVNDLERLCVQAIAWKQDKPFSLKPAITTELRLNLTKFYKLHVFHPNEFFSEPNWTEDVIRDDKPVRGVFVDAEQVKEALSSSARQT
ncbi:MAG: DUF2027 domain-containing protein [Bacteroidaceae bacterium]|nr:DUF2027 domain-containing protein [Bacteroidaceae bacterium]